MCAHSFHNIKFINLVHRDLKLMVVENNHFEDNLKEKNMTSLPGNVPNIKMLTLS